MRDTITIPAAGVTKVFNQFSGRSVIIEDMGVYPTADDVPIMDFQPGIQNYGLYPRSTYPNDKQFNAIKITGTAESAGDEITILTTDQCLDLDINIIFSDSYEAQAGTTDQEVLSDSVFQWQEVDIIDSDGKLPRSVLVSSTQDSFRVAFNADPTQGAGGLGHEISAPGTTGQHFIEIEGIDFILSARFINRTNATPATMNYTFRY